jgi:hypothetical protein
MSNTTDPNLKIPWEIAFGQRSPIEVAHKATDTATVYDKTGTRLPPLHL